MEKIYIAEKYARAHIGGVFGKESKEKLEAGCPLGFYLTQDLDYRRVVAHWSSVFWSNTIPKDSEIDFKQS